MNQGTDTLGVYQVSRLSVMLRSPESQFCPHNKVSMDWACDDYE